MFASFDCSYVPGLPLCCRSKVLDFATGLAGQSPVIIDLKFPPSKSKNAFQPCFYRVWRKKFENQA